MTCDTDAAVVQFEIQQVSVRAWFNNSERLKPYTFGGSHLRLTVGVVVNDRRGQACADMYVTFLAWTSARQHRDADGLLND
jgi:hypothetical protein